MSAAQLEEIFNIGNINDAWKKVKAKGSSAGLDSQTIDHFENNLADELKHLQEQIIKGDYTPEPYKRIYIKKDSKEKRPIAILSLKDRIIQQTVYQHYEEKFNKIFVDTNYAYRKGKGHKKAINRIQDFLMRKYHYLANLDIDNFFDTINRSQLIDKCSTYFNEEKIVNLIKMWIKIGVAFNEKYYEAKNGIAQGGVISPLLANLYLNDFDIAMKTNNYVSIRYADNILILGKSYESAKEASDYAERYLTDYLNLKLNDKISIKSYNEGFTYCGIYFKDKLRRISSEKFDKIIARSKNIIHNTKFEDLPKKFNENINGIERYYYSFDTEDQIINIEEVAIKHLIKRAAKELVNYKVGETKTYLRNINFISSQSKAQKNNIIKHIISSAKQENNGNANLQKNDPEIDKRINIKKRKYQKVWFNNLDVVISTSYSFIGKSTNFISIKNKNKEIQKISSQKIKNIAIAAKGVSISSDAIKLAAEHNIKIDYFDKLGNPYASIIPSVSPIFSLTDQQFKAFDNNKAKHIIIAIIEAKIKNQLNVIKYFTKNKTTISDNESSEINRLIDNSDKLKNIDSELPTEQVRQIVFGIEGSSGAAYWNLFKDLIPSKYEFENREHKSADNVVNIMLNYGYGILYTRVLTAITHKGLNPNFSFLHKEQPNKPTLVFDLIEPFRAPAVDRTVIAILNKYSDISKNGKYLSDQTKSTLSKKVLFRLNAEFKYRSRITSLNNEIIEQTGDLIKFLQDKTKKFKPFVSKW